MKSHPLFPGSPAQWCPGFLWPMLEVVGPPPVQLSSTPGAVGAPAEAGGSFTLPNFVTMGMDGDVNSHSSDLTALDL